jgi:hypothetical protein
LREVHIAAQRHPVVFDRGVGDVATCDGRRRANRQLVGIGPFQIEGQAGLRVDQGNLSAELNLLE